MSYSFFGYGVLRAVSPNEDDIVSVNAKYFTEYMKQWS